MLLVTHIDTYESLDEDIQFKIDNGLGLWTSKNDSELWEDVKNYIQPYTLRSVEYEKKQTTFFNIIQIKMKEFTSTVTLVFEINNLEAIDKQDYIDRLKSFYFDSYGLEVKDYEITDIEESQPVV